MNCLGKSGVCFAAVAMLCATLRAAGPGSLMPPGLPPGLAARAAMMARSATPAQPAVAARTNLAPPATVPDSTVNLSDNPYSMIAARNVFGLVPPPAPPDPALLVAQNLPKITLTGIMSEPDLTEALYKVTPKPGAGGKEEFYTLGEGERQDDIEVLKIDGVKGVVTFDNHGTTQEIPLVEGNGSGGGPGGPTGGPPMMPPPLGRRLPGGMNGPGGITQFGASAAANNSAANGTPGFSGGTNPNPDDSAANSLQSHIYQPPTSTLTPDQATLLIEAQRAALMNDPHPPYSPALLPPTPLTKYTTGEQQ